MLFEKAVKALRLNRLLQRTLPSEIYPTEVEILPLDPPYIFWVIVAQYMIP